MSKKSDPANGEDKWKAFAERQAEEPADMSESVSDEAEPAATEGLTYASHEELEQELNKKDMALAELKEAAMRAKADAENARRRAERDVQNARKFGSERLLTDLLPVVDSLVRGLEGQEPTDQQARALHEGMQLTLDLLEKTLAKHGLEVIEPARGDTFNPEAHEAMSMQPDPELQSNTVSQVLQKGYSLNGRVIRAAMVMVAA